MSRSDCDYYNEQFAITYRLWFETLYKDKYFYMGEAELMSAALLLDVGTYFRRARQSGLRKSRSANFSHLPFEGTAGRLFAGMMKFYNRRLVRSGETASGHGIFRAAQRRLARTLRRLCARFSAAPSDSERFAALVEMRSW